MLVGLLIIFWVAIHADKTVDSMEKLARPAIEGITLVMVVVAVIILGIQGVIDDQGVVGILSAIVGFLLGRGAAKLSG